ncbi:hypothetical protein [Pseudophaeobacter flagellatus]|uniref:hypothetical protein n=1 Tax=Pseudophaeobacter flagellatus TaxID=2899119 RepID=UPI001E337586|nr:hypothetical protein [Pseudophaeobacter flagellatus]MCD9147479.1 hypothetical protein [Pseudophaeobacter flagellatus]
MRNLILIGVGGLSVLTAAYIWIATQHWYHTIPGVAQTGPMNFHFAKDVGLAYLASGVALIWAGVKHDKSAGICGASWLVLHALFHIWIWFHRGTPADLVSLTNLIGIQMPAFAGFISAVNLKSERANT